MEFVSLGAMVVTLRGVVVGGFPIQIAKMKTKVIQDSRGQGYYWLFGQNKSRELAIASPPRLATQSTRGFFQTIDTGVLYGLTASPFEMSNASRRR